MNCHGFPAEAKKIVFQPENVAKPTNPMTDREDYNQQRNPRRRQTRNIEFSDRDIDQRPETPQPTGLRDEHWDAEREYYYDGDEDYDDTPSPHEEFYPREEPEEYIGRRPVRQQLPRGNSRQSQWREHSHEREYVRDEYDYDRDNRDYDRYDREPERNYNRPSYQDQDDMHGKRQESFIKRHPILMNLLYAGLATAVAAWIALWFLDYWTFHGQERAVPDVKGQSLEMAQGNISRAGLKAVVTDSIYDSYARPGTVVEQSPIPQAIIKRGGTVYLTLVAFTPKMVTIPDFYDVSERQARSMLEGLGITQVMVVNVPSEYAGLVMGAKFNGVSLRPGARVPVTAVITLEVGEGMEEIDPDSELVDTTAIEETIEALNID